MIKVAPKNGKIGPEKMLVIADCFKCNYYCKISFYDKSINEKKIYMEDQTLGASDLKGY